MDNETKQMFELVLQKLDKVDSRLDKVDCRLDKVDGRLDNIDSRLDNMDNRLDNMDNRLDVMENRQSEMYGMLRGLEENVKVTRAKQEKMMFDIIDIQGQETKLTQIVMDHESVIKQIRAIT